MFYDAASWDEQSDFTASLSDYTEGLDAYNEACNNGTTDEE